MQVVTTGDLFGTPWTVDTGYKTSVAAYYYGNCIQKQALEQEGRGRVVENKGLLNHVRENRDTVTFVAAFAVLVTAVALF